MPKVLIVDSNKSSVVMTSEAFKDKVPGISVQLAATGKEALEVLSKNKPDIIVADFDLPDTDAVTLTKVLRKDFGGPILITALADKIVGEAINSELHCYNDSCSWISKPVRFDALAEKIDMFLIKNRRINKRYKTSLETTIVGKGEGRGKRSPKMTGKIINLGIGGGMFETKVPVKLKKGEEITFSLAIPLPESNKLSSSTKFKATIQWQMKNKFGLQFAGMTDQQRRGLEELLRNCKEEKDQFAVQAA